MVGIDKTTKIKKKTILGIALNEYVQYYQMFFFTLYEF